MRLKRLVAVATGATIAAMGVAPAGGATSSKEIAVAARAIGFMEPRPGVIPVVVVYQDGNAASAADANMIKAQLERTPIRGATLRVTTASSGNAGAIGGAKVAFLAEGVANQAGVFAVASRSGVLTISSEMGCVAAGRCAVGVRSEPTVEIVVNRRALAASRVGFSKAFLMLVREI